MPRDLPDFDASRFCLATHGDSRQRKWAARILAHWPHYESFWRLHTVPLTFAVLEEDNYFLRPHLPEELEELADTQYAVFFHLAQMHEWTVLMRNRADAKYLGATEMLYTFFSHGASLVDATCSFAAAVDATIQSFGGPTCFGGGRDEHDRPTTLGTTWGMEGDRQKWEALLRNIRRYRNWLVHRKPVFLQNAYMPRADYLDVMSGLAAVARVAQEPGLIEERYEPTVPALERLLEDAAHALDVVWFVAQRALGDIDANRYRRAQLHVERGDESITKQRILAVRDLE